jgi:hypothetical protein
MENIADFISEKKKVIVISLLLIRNNITHECNISSFFIK